MLQTMRHLAQSWLFKGLMMILIVSFGIWGIGDIFRGNPMQRTVATVGGESISVQSVREIFDVAVAQLRRSSPDMTEQQAKHLGLMDTSLQELITRRQVDLATKQFGIDVTDKTALEWFASQPQMHNKDGSLNREIFNRMVEKEHLRESDFLVKWRIALAQRELLHPFVTIGKAPQTIVDAVTKARGQKRILDVVTLANDSVRDIPAPDEKTLRDFYSKNPQSFTAPEYRALTIARLSPGDVTKDVAVTDDQVKKEYEAHSAQFAHPERRDIVQVVVQDEARAKQLAAAARSGGNLANAAAPLGLKAVPINGTEEKTLPPELAKPVFSLSQGQVSDPVQSTLGWHVVQLKKITPPGIASLDEVKDELRETMQKDMAADAATRMANQLDDDLASGRPLEDIADSLRMRLIKIPALDANGKTAEGKDPAELPNKDDVLKAAFGQNAGETSPVIDDKNGNYIVVRTDQVTPSAIRPFEKVKDQVAAAWKTEEQATHAATAAEKIGRALREGKTASSFAAQAGVEVRVSKPVSLMGDNDPALPASVMPQILKMKKGDVVTATVPGHQVVLRLVEFVNLDATAVKTAEDKVRTDIDNQTTDELAGEYMQYLRELFPPKINYDVLEALSQQGS